MDNNLCIIPARGGSKRIPRKNIKDFLGKPIIAYSIETAMQSELFAEIMVSTDDQEIAHIAQQYGAKVPFMRSLENADDHATTMDVLQEVVEQYQKTGREFDYICCIYPTAPLMQVDHLKQGYKKLLTFSSDSVLPVAAFSYPIWRGLKKGTDGQLEMLFAQYAATRSQDLPKVYHDAGQWYWLKPKALRGSLLQNAGFVELRDEEVQDIDEPSDWQLAELKFKIRQSEYL